jgi:hypothetical protein
MLGGVHSACHPTGATVVGVISWMGLTAISGVVVAVLVPEVQQTRGMATDTDQHG